MANLINRRNYMDRKKIELIFVCKVVYLNFGNYIMAYYLLIKGGKVCRNPKCMI